ncbi:MAG: RNA polymerase sigma factor [Bacteroidales bacterium]|nr:RNA polymerase sigma factor [Bacteroidales bacterium]
MLNFFRKKDTDKKFTDIVNKYREPVYWFIRRRVISHDDADDVTQEVFIRIYKSLDTLKDASAEKAWIYRIATNECNRFLTRKYQSTELTEDITNSLMEGEYIDYDEEMQIKFQKALNTLSERQRNVFELRYYEEMSYEQISEVMNSDVSTLKATYYVAKQKITDYILNK